MKTLKTLDNVVKTDNGFTSLTGKSVVLDFYADWCGPCKISSPVVENLSKEITDVDFYKINIDDSPELADTFGIKAIPTFAKITTDSKFSIRMGWEGEEKFKKFVLE